MLFCPKCFMHDEELSLIVKTDKYTCPICGEEYKLSDILVSEQTVRTYTSIAPLSTKDILGKLEKVINAENR